ncbi:MAG: hypothetical protein ACD_33C00036G0002 [uncultured bacterium]|nr:MAG: hypothetical protein ACD_33C00036G0002 [uncultured bacterium]
MQIRTQDPKYDIEVLLNDRVKDGAINARLVNAITGKPIPDNEPIFTIRGKDIHAIDVLYEYRKLCKNKEHLEAINITIKEFEKFALKNSQILKEPDTESISYYEFNFTEKVMV